MVQFLDSFGQERKVEFSLCGKYVNLTIYTPRKSNYGNVLQIPIAAFNELKEEVNNLKIEENNECK